MSDETKDSIGRAATILGIISTIAALAGAWFILPYRVGAAERRIDQLETEQRQARELLVRIDENVKALKERATR